MLVVAPLALIVIAGLVGAMVSMIGDSLIASDRADIAYNIQDTLSQIEQDSRVTTSFMGAFSYFNSPQGRNGDGTTPFSYGDNNDLILTQQATSASPYNNARQLIYYANQPASCGPGSDTSGNRTLFNRVIYFLTANADGTKSLWRRIILNPWNLNSTPDGNTVCSAPWQRSSCPVGSTVSNTPGANCQSIDQKMLDNVTDFVPTFYTSSGDTTSDPTKAIGVSVSVTVSQSVSGTLLTQTSVMRTSRRNDVPAIPKPSKPVVSTYNPGILNYNNPILTSFQWSSTNAYTYTISTKVGAGDWSAPKSTSATNISVSSDPNTPVSIKVTAVNDSGVSDPTQYDSTPILFSNMSLAADSVCFKNGASPYYCPSFTRTTAGVVVLRGIVTSGTDGSGIITTLPQGFRPNKQITFTAESVSDTLARVDVMPDGTVTWVNSKPGSWLSLDSIRFLSSDLEPLSWTDPDLYCPTGCTTPWTNSGGNYKSLQFTKDSMGRAHLYGRLTTPSPYPPANYSNMTSVPADYQPPTSDMYPDSSGVTPNDVYASFNIDKTVTEFRTNLGSTYKSFAAMYYPDNGMASWQTVSIPTPSGWGVFSGKYSSPAYTKAADNLVTIRGLIAGGTATAGTVLFTLPLAYSPSSQLVFLVAGYNSGVEVPARIDVTSTGQVILTDSMSNNYLSLAGISYYQDQAQSP